MFPGEIQKKIQVVPLYGILSHLRVHPLKLGELFLKVFGHLFAPLLFLGPGFHLLDLLVVGDPAQFLLYGLHLLMKEILPLLLVHIQAYLGLEFVSQLKLLKLRVQVLQCRQCPVLEAFHFQQLLFFLNLEVQVRTHEVYQKGIALDISDRKTRLAGYVGVVLDDFQGQFLDGVDDGGKLHTGLIRTAFPGFPDGGRHIRFLGEYFGNFKPLFSLNDHSGVPIRHLEDPEDPGHGSQGVDVLNARVFNRFVLLGNHADDLGSVVGILYQVDGLIPPGCDGDHHAGKKYGIAQRQDGKGFRQFLVVHFLLVFWGQQGYEFRILVQILKRQFVKCYKF